MSLFLIATVISILPLLIESYRTITGTWPDNFVFNDNGDTGWKDIGDYGTLENDPVTNGVLYDYHGPYYAHGGDGISPIHQLSQQFYCKYPSDITISYKLASCAADSGDKTRFFYNSAPKEEIDGNINGNTLSDNTLNNKCSAGWEYVTKQWTNIGSVQSNELFEPKWEFTMNTGDYYVVFDININCDGTAYPTSSPITTTSSPTSDPITLSPTPSPTNNPTPAPTDNPTPSPTIYPSPSPTNNPSKTPTINPTEIPTISPIKEPTKSPTSDPIIEPTLNPSISPTFNPFQPSKYPTLTPTERPFKISILSPTNFPSKIPTISSLKSGAVGDENDNKSTQSVKNEDLDVGNNKSLGFDKWVYIIIGFGAICCCLIGCIIIIKFRKRQKFVIESEDLFRHKANNNMTDYDGEGIGTSTLTKIQSNSIIPLQTMIVPGNDDDYDDDDDDFEGPNTTNINGDDIDDMIINDMINDDIEVIDDIEINGDTKGGFIHNYNDHDPDVDDIDNNEDDEVLNDIDNIIETAGNDIDDIVDLEGNGQDIDDIDNINNNYQDNDDDDDIDILQEIKTPIGAPQNDIDEYDIDNIDMNESDIDDVDDDDDIGQITIGGVDQFQHDQQNHIKTIQ